MYLYVVLHCFLWVYGQSISDINGDRTNYIDTKLYKNKWFEGAMFVILKYFKELIKTLLIIKVKTRIL